MVNPDAKSPLMRKRINEPYMGYAQSLCVRVFVSCCVGPYTRRNRWFDFLRWLDTCSDPNCARYHHYEVRTSPPCTTYVATPPSSRDHHSFHGNRFHPWRHVKVEKLRERPSPLVPRFVDYVWWYLAASHGPRQLERRYEIFSSRFNRRLASTSLATVAACLAVFLPLRLHYYPAISQVAFFAAFTGVGCLLYVAWAVVAERLHRHGAAAGAGGADETEKKGLRVEGLTVPTTDSAALLPHSDRVGLNDVSGTCNFPLRIPQQHDHQLTTRHDTTLRCDAKTEMSPSGGTVLPAKYHFHTNVAHYHQEVREKSEGHHTDGDTEMDPASAIVNPYSPLPDSAPLLRVPYTCPLFDIVKVRAHTFSLTSGSR